MHGATEKYRSYRGLVGKASPNVLARQFEADQPNQKWVTDVTEFKVAGEKLYLSPVLDLFNGEIVAYQTDTRPRYALVGRMLEQALEGLPETAKPMLHSDQGWHYQYPDYRERLEKAGLKQSMSRKGNCLDNATMESFLARLSRSTSTASVSITSLSYKPGWTNTSVTTTMIGSR